MSATEAMVAKLESIRNLPTLPAVIMELTRAIQDPSSDARRVAGIIEDDPAIMARILRVVNSAFYAGKEPIRDVQHAVTRLGVKAINNVAMSTAVFSAFGKGPNSLFNREAFWKHSICVGLSAAAVRSKIAAPKAKLPDKDALRLAGLLHDVGKIVLDEYFHDDFMKAVELSAAGGLSLLDAEVRVFGISHAHVGAWLGTKWHVEDEMVKAIRWHHEPTSMAARDSDLVSLCHIANYLCNTEHIGDGGDHQPVLAQAALDRLGIRAEDMSAIAELAREESTKSDVLMALM